jgi:hypothetical protein
MYGHYKNSFNREGQMKQLMNHTIDGIVNNSPVTKMRYLLIHRVGNIQFVIKPKTAKNISNREAFVNNSKAAYEIIKIACRVIAEKHFLFM